MAYCYQKERPNVFTEEGTKMLLKIRDHVNSLLKTSGAFKIGNAISCVTGDSWMMLACIDYLAEMGEIKCVRNIGWGQDQVYVSGNERNR